MNGRGPKNRNGLIGRLVAPAATLLVGLTGAVAAWAATGIKGSPHDLTGRAVGAASQICMYCHVPQTPGAVDATLWASHDTGNGGFTAYGDPALVDPTAVKPQGTSLVCLSCHDSVIAPQVHFPGAPPFWVTTSIATGARGFSDSHPVSVPFYRNRDPGVRRPVSGQVGELPLFRAAVGERRGERVECASCHNPHQVVFGKFLRVANVSDGLCRNCHKK